MGDLFGETTEDTRAPTAPIEPLYTMLMGMREESLRYTLKSLQDFKKESELDEYVSNVGVTKRTYIKQVMLAMASRGIR